MIKKYITAFTSFVRLAFLKYVLRLNISFHYLQSHSLFSNITVNRAGKLVLAKNTQFSAGCEIFSGKGALIEIGERTYFNKRCMVSAHSEVVIGKNCLFGPDVKIYDNNHVFQYGLGVIPEKHKSAPIKIGNACWIASNVIVLPGVTIGDNSVIGAGVVLKSSVPDNTLVTIDKELKYKEIT